MTDQELVSGLISQQREAFEKLVDKFQHRIFMTCYGIVQNKENAEDLTQEVFIEVHRSVKNFRSESSLSTWLYRIAINKSLNFRKSELRKAFWNSMQNLFYENSEREEDFISVEKNPAELMERNEQERLLQQAIDSLPENQKVAFVLAKYEELSYEEIAGVMQKHITAVESLIHRAKLNLQKKLIQLI